MKNLLLCLALFTGVAHASTLRTPMSPFRADTAIHPTLINGTVVTSGWDQVVSIRTGSAGCTATIVGPQAIITAAHCAGNGATSVFTVKGKQYSAKITRAPLYPGKDHDIAVGKVTEVITGIEPHSIGGKVEKGKELTLLGYGCTQPGGSGGNDGKLRIGKATVVNFSGFDAVSSNGSALCYGDSGGPGYLENEPAIVNGAGEVILPSKSVLATINSKGNIKDTNYTTRLDLPESQTFLKDWATKEGVQLCGINLTCGSPAPEPKVITMSSKVGDLTFKVLDSWLKEGNDVEFVRNAALQFMKYVAGETH